MKLILYVYKLHMLYMEYFYNNIYFKGFYHVSFYKNAEVPSFLILGKLIDSFPSDVYLVEPP